MVRPEEFQGAPQSEVVYHVRIHQQRRKWDGLCSRLGEHFVSHLCHLIQCGTRHIQYSDIHEGVVGIEGRLHRRVGEEGYPSFL